MTTPLSWEDRLLAITIRRSSSSNSGSESLVSHFGMDISASSPVLSQAGDLALLVSNDVVLVQKLLSRWKKNRSLRLCYFL